MPVSDPWRYKCTECPATSLKMVQADWKDHNYRCDNCGAKLEKIYDKKRDRLVKSKTPETFE